MSMLSLTDARIFGQALKAARKKQHMTQEAFAEMLDLSLPYYKDIEHSRSVPSLGVYYNICRTLNLSADQLIFFDNALPDAPSYQELLRLLPRLHENSLAVLTATALALIEHQDRKPL